MIEENPRTAKRRVNPTVFLLIFFVVLDFLAFYAAFKQREMQAGPIPLSAAAPAVNWVDLEGKQHTLKELQGHVVVLHFWAAWCPPCREEFPKLLKVAADNPDLRILTVSSDDDKDKAIQFIKAVPDMSGIKAPPNVLYAWDPARIITYDQFLTARYPESIIIDPTGHMRRKYPMPVNWDARDVRDYLQEIKKPQ